MPTVDFLPVAITPSANVDTQATYAGSAYQTNGFTAGTAKSIQMNKTWRQGTVMASAIAWFIANILNVDVLDNGDRPGLTSLFTEAIQTAAAGAANRGQVVPYAATVNFDVTLGPVIEMTLTGNVNSSTISGQVPFQIVRFIIHQDGTGGRIFNPPANFPMPGADPGPSNTTVYSAIVDATGTFRPLAGETVS